MILVQRAAKEMNHDLHNGVNVLERSVETPIGVPNGMPGAIDVWEGASGASHDAPRFSLKSNLVSNARKKNAHKN